MTTEVHPTAIVSPDAELDADVAIGPYAVVGPEVCLGRGTSVGAHAQIQGPATIGEENRIFPFAVVGFDPQDLKYRGEASRLVVGHRNIFREFCTIHRGTSGGSGETVVGDENLFMAYSHVAHDCRIGSHAILANYAGLAGHIEVEDWAFLGAYVGCHQFIRIGSHAYVGAFTVIRQDVLPFCKTDGRDARTYGINTVGLTRRGFSAERVQALERAYRLLVRSRLNTSQALERIGEELPGQPDVANLVAFIRASQRGFHK
ncbi:MAG TPA: acyl-ACP--UDP-N-acetylglucosamine O-acyltransferase [Thermoanaerobaculia bacterium]|nr:acyl-ACP--UDP-N-acetylglucosamine O-acyltransferase [Thermoanaerobaculia bacterium]